eukprot:523709_1
MATRLTKKQKEKIRTKIFNQYITKMRNKGRRRPKKRYIVRDSDCLKLTIIASLFLVVFIMIFTQWTINYSYNWSSDHFIIENLHNHTATQLDAFWTCFTNGIENKAFNNGYKCDLDDNEIILNHEIARGGQGVVYSITINATEYVLKHSYAKDICYHLKREWITLKLIGQNEHMLSLHKTLSHLYECPYSNNQSQMHCFIIIELVNNSITMFDLLEYHANRSQRLTKTTIQKIKDKKLNQLEWMNDQNKLLSFVLNCYNDVKNTLDILRDGLIFYSDELIHNVLLNIDNNHCVLIDFGLVAEMRDSADILSELKHLDHKMKYSPYSAYYLHSFHSRKSVMNRYIFEWQGIKQLQKIAYWNTLHKVAAFALRVFVISIMDVIRQSEYHSYLNQSSWRQLDAIQNKLYDLDKIRRVSPDRYWLEREEEINLLKTQMTQLNEKHQFFDSDMTSKFFALLGDIHTDKSMRKS